MKKIVLIALLCMASAFAQEKKYQSLLWEVSGNGLTKKSYLYGSMHVSDKVSYHLSDAFFTHLLNADIVANESEPSTWTDLFGIFSPDYNRYQAQFYSEFYQTPLTKEQLYPLFRSNNFTLNNLLFRTNEYNKEYQEETYLDMFIYRTGKKYNKKTVGLEDTKTSIIGLVNADLTNSKPKEENRAAIQKILKNNGYDEALMNFYRDKDLDMIDSLTSLSTSENYLKALLYDRNIVMVKSIDSLAKQGSLFAAVGAAHLPGKRGIIEMLRAKGYIVKPIFDSYTDKGKARKQQIEEYFSKPFFKRRSTPDGIIDLALYTSVIENKENLESPDLANGGYINVKRLLLRDYLKKDNKPFDHKSIDSLFYENIPGKILEKKFYTQDGYTVYDIKNITKTGNAQHYKYFITPLEIITVSMSGEGNYVRQFENDIFNGISLKPISGSWKTMSPKRGGFSVELPDYTVIYGDRTKASSVPDIEMHSYDRNEQANYFVLERTLHSNDDLVNSLYELKRIQYEFYSQFDIDSTQTRVHSNPLSYTSSSTLGSKTIRLKTLIKGGKYYLLGSVGASESNTNKFFSSFAFKPYISNEEYRTFIDSTSYLSIEIPKAPNEKLDFIAKKQINRFSETEKVNLYREKYSDYSFILPSGQTVDLSFYEHHRYEPKRELDTIWKSFRRMVTGYEKEEPVEDFDLVVEAYADYDGDENSVFAKKGTTPSTWYRNIRQNKPKNTTKILNETVSFNKEKNYHQIDLLAVDEQSEQAIKYRGIYKDGISYTMNTLVDKNYKNDDKDIEKVFNSLTLISEIDRTILPGDKLKLFMNDVSSEHDSIRYSALASIRELKIDKNNVNAFISFIKGFDFKNTETNALVSLYSKLGYVEDPAVVPFLEEQYKKDNSNTIIQFAVLNALTSQKSKEAYKKIMELLEYDLPLSDGTYEITSLFDSFEEDPKHSEVLFPDILQFYSIQEYHQPIVEFTAALLDNENIRPKKLTNYKKMILTNAKLELKRVKSRIANQEAEEDEDMYYDGNTSLSGDLSGYLNLLYPFRNDKGVKQFYDDTKALGLKEINLEMARLDIINNNINKTTIEGLLQNEETLFTVNNMLLTKKEAALVKHISDMDIAKSAMFTLGSLKPKKDSLTFLENRIMTYENKEIKFFFYNIKDISGNSYRTKTDRLGAIVFINSGDKIDALAYKYIEPRRIADEDEMQQYIKAIIDETLNEDKSRATFGKNQYDEEIPYEDYGGDY